jgi:hypothetical protein
VWGSLGELAWIANFVNATNLLSVHRTYIVEEYACVYITEKGVKQDNRSEELVISAAKIGKRLFCYMSVEIQTYKCGGWIGHSHVDNLGWNRVYFCR